MIANNDILALLESTEAKSFITKHINDNLVNLNLQFRNKVGFNLTACLQLIGVYQKAGAKLPMFKDQLLALDDRSYQQATSQKVAAFKSQIIQGKNLLDLSGGLGVDDIYFSASFEKVVSIDSNAQLNEYVKYNLTKLGIANVERHTAEAESFAIEETFDWIYIDPDRRSNGRRHVSLDQLQPNITFLIPQLKEKTSKIAIKLSPLFDIKEAIRSVDFLSDVLVISEQNEVKEVLLLIDFDQTTTPAFHAIEVGNNAFQLTFDNGDVDSIDQQRDMNTDTLQRFLFLPRPSVLKLGKASAYFHELGCLKYGDYYIYTNEKALIKDSHRCFEVLASSSLNEKEIKAMLAKRGVNQLNLIIKGLKDQPAIWHQKLKTKDGGHHYLFILKGKEKEAILTTLFSAQ